MPAENTDAIEEAVHVIEEALRKGDPGGFMSPNGHAWIAVQALLTLPVGERMEAMGMEEVESNAGYWFDEGAGFPVWREVTTDDLAETLASWDDE